ncbi:hypothetical protein FDZ71_09995 [bacterium]|nr:MAG: hypothetical protein FDZ71_09995 [bacterium]
MAEKGKVIRMKLKLGNVEAEVECQEDQLKKAVQDFIEAVQDLQAKTPTPQETSTSPIEARLTTCKSILAALWKEGWFQVARNLAETHDEMSRRGYHYDRSAVAHTLAELVRDGILTREGKKGEYVYLQKRPPS